MTHTSQTVHATHVEYRIPHPTKPYGYVSVLESKPMETELKDGEIVGRDSRIVAREIRNRYDELTKAFEDSEAGAGLPPKEWAQVRKGYMAGEPLSPDTFYAMDEKQQFFIQEIKKELRANK